MRVAGQEQDLIGLPSLRRKPPDDRSLEAGRKGEDIGRDDYDAKSRVVFGKWLDLSLENRGFVRHLDDNSNFAAAWSYVQYHLGRADVQANIYRSSDLFPSLESAWRSPYMREADPYYGGQKDRLMFETLAKKVPVAYIYSSDYEQMDSLMSTELQKYALGQETAQQALKNAANAIRSRTGRS